MGDVNFLCLFKTVVGGNVFRADVLNNFFLFLCLIPGKLDNFEIEPVYLLFQQPGRLYVISNKIILLSCDEDGSRTFCGGCDYPIFAAASVVR